MSNSVAKQVGEVIDELAKRLQVPAENLWTVMVRQAHITGITDMLVGLVSLLAIFLFCIWFYCCWKNKKFKNESMEMNGYEIIATGGFIISFFLLFIGSCFVFEGIKEIYNPEYYAIELIGNMFK